MKLGIIGSGRVGNIVAYTAAMKGHVNEIIFNDIEIDKSKAEAMDINDGNLFYPHKVTAKYGDYKELAGCNIIVVCSGMIPESLDRLDEFELNKEAVDNYIPRVVEEGFNGIFIVVTNPCDIITYEVWKKSGFPSNRVIGSGTALDSARFNTIVGEKLNIDPKSVRGMMLGEHGDSQFAPWSNIYIGNRQIDEYKKDNPEKFANFNKDEIEEAVTKRGMHIFAGKGSTQYGIGNTVNQIINSIINDNKEILNVSALLSGEYGLKDLYISTPCIIGKDGIEEIIELELTEEELEKYNKSANIIKDFIKKL